MIKQRSSLSANILQLRGDLQSLLGLLGVNSFLIDGIILYHQLTVIDIEYQDVRELTS